MLKTKVKASSVTHLTDARYFAAWEAEWLGFNLSANESTAVDPRQVAALQGWVDGVKICGEFNLPTAADLKTATELMDLDAIQVDMFTTQTTIQEWDGTIPVIKEIVINADSTADSIAEMLANDNDWVAYFLLNFTKGNISFDKLSTLFPLTQLEEWANQYAILLEIDLGDTTPSNLLEQIGIKGFNVRGGEEEKVGLKSFDELDEFFEDLEVLV